MSLKGVNTEGWGHGQRSTFIVGVIDRSKILGEDTGQVLGLGIWTHVTIYGKCYV